MENLLSGAEYCRFDPEDWESATNIECTLEERNLENDGTWHCYCEEESELCSIHGPVSVQTPDTAARNLLERIQTAPSNEANTKYYNQFHGAEFPGLNFQGRTVGADENYFLDFTHTIYHDLVNLAATEVTNNVGFVGCLFKEPLRGPFSVFKTSLTIFDDSEFKEGIQLDEAQFEGDLRFNHVTVDGNLSLSGASIKDELMLQNGTIHGDLVLKNIDIKGYLQMDNVTIDGNLILEQSVIEGGVSAESLSVGGEIQARAATIGHFHAPDCEVVGDSTFVSSRFRSRVNLENGKFYNDIDFTDVTFEGEFNFKRITVVGGAIFCDSSIGYRGIFIGAKLHSDVDLAGAELPNGILAFSAATIRGTLKLQYSHGMGIVHLIEATISGGIELEGTEIRNELLVNNTTILDDVLLDNALISGNLDFSEAQLNGCITISNTSIQGNLRLNDTSVFGHLTFENSTIEQCIFAEFLYIKEGVLAKNGEVGGPTIDFDNAVARGPISLTQCAFESRIHFSGVQANEIGFTDCYIENDLNATEIQTRTTWRLFESKSENDEPPIESQIEAGDLDCTGTTIEGDCIIADSKIAGAVRFGQSTITGHLNAQSVSVEEQMNLSQAKILDQVRLSFAEVHALHCEAADLQSVIDLYRAHVRGEAIFNECNHEGSTLYLFEARIEGNLSFSDSGISGRIFLSDVTVTGDLLFSGGNYLRSISLQDSQILGDIVAEKISIDEELRTNELEVSGDVQITESELDDEVSFSDSEFAGMVEFSGSHIARSIKSEETDFEGILTLENAQVDGEIQIQSNLLARGMNWRDLRVGSNVTITDSRVLTTAFLGETIFKWDVTLRDVSFEKPPIFRGAEFRHRLNLLRITTASSNDSVDLTNTTIEQGTINQDEESPVTFDLTNAVLGNVSLDSNPELSWRKLILSRTRYKEFDFNDHSKSLREISYRIPGTGPVPTIWRDRIKEQIHCLPAVYRSEYRKGLIERFDELEATYRQAKDGADQMGDNTLAGEFFQREKNHQKKRLFWEGVGLLHGDSTHKSSPLKWLETRLLDFLAGYGEQPRTVVLKMLLTMLAFIPIYAYFMGELSTLQSYVFHIEPIQILTSRPALMSFGSFVSLVYPPPGTNPSETIRLLTHVERFLGAGFIALLVLTLTRSIYR